MAKVMSGPAELLLVSVTILAIGFLTAVVARLLLRTRGRAVSALSWSASTLCAIVGAAIGSAGTALLLGRPLRDAPVLVVLGGLVGTIVAVAAGDAIARRRQPPALPATALMHAGESEHVEFKSSARYNRHTKARDARLELVIATSVAGFLNARGGTLLIGVADDGSPVGLDDDYALVKSASRDGFELWLRDLLTTTLGAPATAAITVDFAEVDGHDICLVRSPKADRPVFVRAPKQQSTQFPVRVGNSTRILAPHELLDYAAGRWGRRHLLHRT
jgi:hypothetical protein